MPDSNIIKFSRANKKEILSHGGTIVLFAQTNGQLFPSAAPINKACRDALSWATASTSFKKLTVGKSLSLAFPAGVAANKIIIIKLDRAASRQESQRAGANLAQQSLTGKIFVLGQGLRRIGDVAFGAELRSYRFDRHKREGSKDKKKSNRFIFVVHQPKLADAKYQSCRSIASGITFARDLVNEPANILSTDEFASRLLALRRDGVDVTILDEDQLNTIGMRALLAVGQGSSSPSYVAIMKWKGASGPPLVLAGKGVVFDSGGISLKPPGRMAQMTMDMAGAATVAGVMKTIAQRQAKTHVIGIVGLVENMPSGRAQRPGDVVRSLKGDTVEVINTDAEGRLVLADLLWHAQTQFSPSGIIDLATLTGAIIVALGAEFAGTFSNNDKFCAEFLTAAHAVGERAWRMPLAKSFDRLLKSTIADMKNVGGRNAGAITAAQFLQRFVKPSTPWIHLDIAGVAVNARGTDLAPGGATGWGVHAIDQLIRNRFEDP